MGDKKIVQILIGHVLADDVCVWEGIWCIATQN